VYLSGPMGFVSRLTALTRISLEWSQILKVIPISQYCPSKRFQEVPDSSRIGTSTAQPCKVGPRIHLKSVSHFQQTMSGNKYSVGDRLTVISPQTVMAWAMNNSGATCARDVFAFDGSL